MTYTPTTDDMQTAAGLAGWSTDEWREWYYTMRAEVRAQAPCRMALEAATAHSDRAVGCGRLRHPGGAGGGDPMSPALVRPMTRPTTTHSPRSDGGFSMPKEAK